MSQSDDKLLFHLLHEITAHSLLKKRERQETRGRNESVVSKYETGVKVCVRTHKPETEKQRHLVDKLPQE